MWYPIEHSQYVMLEIIHKSTSFHSLFPYKQEKSLAQFIDEKIHWHIKTEWAKILSYFI